MRVIAGTLKSRRLRMPVGVRIRPTADRVKEGMFNCLGPNLSGLRVLDLFAGSGSLGIEALSRGAKSCTFVDQQGKCLRTLKDNLKLLELTQESCIIKMSVEEALRDLGEKKERFDLILSDPPYFKEDTKNTLHLIVTSAILAPSARVVVEHHRDTSIDETWDQGLEVTIQTEKLKYQMTKRYGDSAVSFLVYA